MNIIGRTDRGLLAHWLWTVDRWLVAAVLFLMVSGILLCIAASPPVAERLDLTEFHFVKRQLVYLVPALGVLLATSLMTPRQIRRTALIVGIVGYAALILTLFIGAEVKGATRWLDLGPVSIQPSEFLKPAFVILAAWMFSESMRRPEMPGTLIATGLFVAFVAVLVLQPDYGQTVLVAATWGLMLFLTGLSFKWISGLAVCGMGAMAIAYSSVPHVARRVDRFLNPEAGDTFQVDAALESFNRGGFLGEGPGEGTVKRFLPDAHSDFIFAVAGEELGIFACLIILGAFAYIVLRGMRHAVIERDPFLRLATVGLISLFGLQAIINMSVNVALMPAKGMTLPFISYGGSSLISMAFAIGAVLAFTRRRGARGGELGPSVWAVPAGAVAR